MAAWQVAVTMAQAPAGAAELAIGVFAHGVEPFRSVPPPFYLEGTEERGTMDVELLWRSRRLPHALRPRLTAKLQLNTVGRTSFAAVGLEWRQYAWRQRLYGQIGFGLAVQDGYRYTPDPDAPGLSPAEAMRRAGIVERRTAFGSTVLFNPNLSLGVRVAPRWAVEAAFEHYSHKGVFAEQNPGIHNLGLRLVRELGGR